MSGLATAHTHQRGLPLSPSRRPANLEPIAGQRGQSETLVHANALPPPRPHRATTQEFFRQRGRTPFPAEPSPEPGLVRPGKAALALLSCVSDNPPHNLTIERFYK
jgi:hypothetical protein